MPPWYPSRCIPALYLVDVLARPLGTPWCVSGFYTFNTGVGERKPLGKGRPPFLPQDIPFFPGETSPLGRRNPLQKALLHKDVRNVGRSQKVTSNPPRCYEPPFHTGKCPPLTPAPGSGF